MMWLAGRWCPIESECPSVQTRLAVRDLHSRGFGDGTTVALEPHGSSCHSICLFEGSRPGSPRRNGQ